MAKILVTGGAGFIGSQVVDALIKKKHKVVIIDNLSTGKLKNINPSAKFIKMDIGEPGLEKILAQEKFEVIFHLAAQIDVRKSVADPITDAQTNIIGSLNLIAGAHRQGVKKIIFSSTGGALYGDTDIRPTLENHPTWPVSPYGIAKLTIEHYLYYYHQLYQLDYIVLRYGNVYGPRQNASGEAGVVAIFCNKILNNERPLIWGEGKQTRDYVFVQDVARANILALESEKIGHYNVGTSIETDVNQLAELIKKSLAYKEEIKHGPAKPGEQQTSSLDYQKIKKELGWQPKMKLADGIKLTADWFKKQYQNHG